MENTYNYFFSSTPQVLAGILGLFGVFIVFKISDIKIQLARIRDLTIEKFCDNKVSFYNKNTIGPEIIELAERNKFSDLYDRKDEVSKCIKELGKHLLGDRIDEYFRDYEKLSNLKNQLIKKTIFASWFTLIDITYCLIMVIFGFWINHCTLWSIIAFIPAIALSIFIFYKLISIIIYSFED